MQSSVSMLVFIWFDASDFQDWTKQIDSSNRLLLGLKKYSKSHPEVTVNLVLIAWGMITNHKKRAPASCSMKWIHITIISYEVAQAGNFDFLQNFLMLSWILFWRMKNFLLPGASFQKIIRFYLYTVKFQLIYKIKVCNSWQKDFNSIWSLILLM